MSAPIVTADDIAAIRKEEGGLAGLIAMLTSRPAAQAPTPPAIGSAHASPGHRPGAWPAGTRTPGPNTCSPDCTCSLAPNHNAHAVPPAA